MKNDSHYQRKGPGAIHSHCPDYVGSWYVGTNDKAKTFRNEEVFYYVNFLDRDGEFHSEYSKMVEGKSHAINLAKWYTNNKGALSRIPY